MTAQIPRPTPSKRDDESVGSGSVMDSIGVITLDTRGLSALIADIDTAIDYTAPWPAQTDDQHDAEPGPDDEIDDQDEDAYYRDIDDHLIRIATATPRGPVPDGAAILGRCYANVDLGGVITGRMIIPIIIPAHSRIADDNPEWAALVRILEIHGATGDFGHHAGERRWHTTFGDPTVHAATVACTRPEFVYRDELAGYPPSEEISLDRLARLATALSIAPEDLDEYVFDALYEQASGPGTTFWLVYDPEHDDAEAKAAAALKGGTSAQIALLLEHLPELEIASHLRGLAARPVYRNRR